MDRRQFITGGAAVATASAAVSTFASVSERVHSDLILKEAWLEFPNQEERADHLCQLLGEARFVSQSILATVDDWNEFNPLEPAPYQAWVLAIEEGDSFDLVGWQQTFYDDPSPDSFQFDRNSLKAVSAETWIKRFNPQTWKEWLMVPTLLNDRINPLFTRHGTEKWMLNFLCSGHSPEFESHPILDVALKQTRGFLVFREQMREVLKVFGWSYWNTESAIQNWAASDYTPLICDTPTTPDSNESLTEIFFMRELNLGFLDPEFEVAWLLRRWASSRHDSTKALPT